MQFLSLALTSATEVIYEDFQSEAPIYSRFTLYWRDNVMLAGLIACIIGLVISIFAKSLFFALLFLIAAGVILFGMYYVSRYAELREMEAQLSELRTQMVRLETTNDNLEGSVATFQTELVSLGKTCESLTTLKDEKEQLLRRTEREFELFRNANEHHVAIVAQYKETARELKAIQEKMIRLQFDEQQIKAQVQFEADRLTRIRMQIDESVEELQTVSRTLRTQSTAHLVAMERLPIDLNPESAQTS